MQQDKMEGSWDGGGQDGGKAEWKNERSLSSLLKHSCFLCWSTPRESEAAAPTSGAPQQDGRVVTKAAEIRVRRPQHLALVCVRLCALLLTSLSVLPSFTASVRLQSSSCVTECFPSCSLLMSCLEELDVLTLDQSLSQRFIFRAAASQRIFKQLIQQDSVY